MVTREVDLDGCPVTSCDLVPSKVVVTTEGTKLTTQNMVQAQTCLHPTMTEVGDEQVPASYIVFHDSLEDEQEQPECEVNVCDADADDGPLADGYALCEEHDTDDARDLLDKRTERGADEAGGDEGPDPDDLPDKARKVFDRAYDELQGGGTITRAAFKGKCSDLDMSPEYISETTATLVDQGYLDEPEDAVLELPE